MIFITFYLHSVTDIQYSFKKDQNTINSLAKHFVNLINHVINIIHPITFFVFSVNNLQP